MELRENPLNQCNFIRNLYTKIADIHNEVIEHEDSISKCEICSKNTNEYSFIKNQLFIILRINLKLKNEEHLIEEQHDNKSINAKEEEEEAVGDPADVYSNFPTTFVSVEDHVDNNEKSEEYKKLTVEDCLSSDAIKIGNKHYECDMCNLRVSRKSSIVLHIKSHLRSRKMLRKSKHQNRDGKDPWRRKTEEPERKQCPFCYRIYKRKHECSWGGVKTSSNFPCAHCPEIFSTFEKILRHHKTHHPEKPRPLSPFQCEICGSLATRISDLRRHMLSHTDVRPFNCNVCEKRYRTKNELEEHQRRHIPKSERDDKYQCDLCRKRYISRSSLTNHKRFQHSVDRKYFPCNFCGLKFISESSLRIHQAIHDGEPPRAHKCEECGRIFEKLKYFNHHRKVRHNIFTDLMLNLKAKKKE